MGLDKFSNIGSFEEMAEQQEASEVKTPVATTPDATPVAEAVATEPVTTEAGDQPCDCKDEACDCKETAKTE